MNISIKQWTILYVWAVTGGLGLSMAAVEGLTPAWSFRQSDRAIVFTSGTTPIVGYRFAEVPYKPYIETLCTPTGINVVRDAPEDHLHHHGLMFAVKADGVNFWEEKTEPGLQVHTVFDGPQTVGAGALEYATLTEALEWKKSADAAPLLIETRRVDVRIMSEPNATLLTWQSTFAVPEGKASTEITGSNYHGLGIRFLESMDFEGEFLNGSGGSAVAGTNDKRANWCAYRARAEGAPVTVAMFDAPTNLRHPATWYTMDTPFAYLSATLEYHRQPVKVATDAPLTLTYGVALFDGHAPADEIEQTYTKWVALLSPQDGKK